MTFTWAICNIFNTNPIDLYYVITKFVFNDAHFVFEMCVNVRQIKLPLFIHLNHILIVYQFWDSVYQFKRKYRELCIVL